MNIKNTFLFFLGCLYSSLVFCQLDTYNHKMEISGIENQWHKIELTTTLFSEISQNMTDLRIYGVTESDTIEAPYILKVNHSKHTRETINFRLLNSTSNANGFYYTFEIPTVNAIDQIKLEFENENFDWKIILEGSQDQNQWYTILNNYRVLSIKNTQTQYTFTDLNFPNSKYQYYKLSVQADKKPNLKEAQLSNSMGTSARYNDYTAIHMNVNHKNKQTFLDIDFKERVPISFLRINILDSVDYYRPFTIEYIADSVKTEKGWRHNYRNLNSGTLNSVEKNEYTFDSRLAQKLRVTISNYDNQPLTIESVTAKGYVHELIARFTKPATYYLAYGKANARKPQYDILQTASKIPIDLSILTLEAAQDIPKKEMPTVAQLFENKLWLWGVMGIVILVLGGFTLKMMQKK